MGIERLYVQTCNFCNTTRSLPGTDGNVGGWVSFDYDLCPECVAAARAALIPFGAPVEVSVELPNPEDVKSRPGLTSPFFSRSSEKPQGVMKVTEDGTIVGKFNGEFNWDSFIRAAQASDGLIFDLKLIPAEEEK